MHGNTNCEFLEKINLVPPNLKATGIWHCSRESQTGIYVGPEDFIRGKCTIIHTALKAYLSTLIYICMPFVTFIRMLNTWWSWSINNPEAIMEIIECRCSYECAIDCRNRYVW